MLKEYVVSTGSQEIKSGLTIMLAPAHFEKLVNWFVSGDEAGEAYAVVCLAIIRDTARMYAISGCVRSRARSTMELPGSGGRTCDSSVWL